ncbi:hypothetical protein [Nocardioides sp. URHA0032]|uniref:hypothetical protein n=1 Tax=Nocardioides sp. URHA0032 TaxID=1380388 RepID=UPI0004920DDA|nr:hypothetical protein [Nocardioides sp. URHA0032]
MVATDDDKPFRGEVRLAGHRRVSHGLGRPLRSGLTDEEEFVRDLEAYLLVLPKSAVFTHLTGAQLLGWQLPRLPEHVPVFVAVDLDDPRPRRHGLICSRLVRERRPVKRARLPVEAPEEILLRAARDLGLIDLVVLIDSALRVGDLDPDRMTNLLASGRPGVRMLREAWRRATGKSDSGGESVLQQFHVVMDIPFVPQAEIRDEAGRLLAQADLLVEGTTFLHEYDGAHHRGRDQHRIDLRRERGLTGSPYVRRGFVLDDLVNHPGATMHELDRALGRTHDVRRLRRWRALVDNSMYSATGRERMMNRWRRQDGIIDWSKSA